jgi:hypothetical protein
MLLKIGFAIQATLSFLSLKHLRDLFDGFVEGLSGGG